MWDVMAVRSKLFASFANIRRRWRRSTPVGAAWIALALLLPGMSEPAAARPEPPIIFSVQEQSGSFYTRGVVEFCYDGECLFADIDLGFPGHFTIPFESFRPGVPYTVMIYDTKMNVLYELREWVFEPELYDRHWDSLHEANKFLVFPQFHAQADGTLRFEIVSTLNPQWEDLTGRGKSSRDVDLLPDYPNLWAGCRANFMLGGKFTSDSDAAGGVIDGKTGFGLTVGMRTGFPETKPERDGWLGFREFSVTYVQNRYDTREVMTPGRLSDVTLHRVNLAYGFGRVSQDNRRQWTAAAVLSVGGVWDAGRKLRYLDRTYGLVGAGVQAAYGLRIHHDRRVDVGLWVQVELIHYPVDAADDDYWYGLAPAAAVGLMVY